MNELWKYDPDTNNWVWLKGGSTVNQAGTYGTVQVEGSANTPGCRNFAANWIDTSGDLWLFGGNGYGSSTAPGSGAMSDVWRYDVSTNNWTWMKGSHIVKQDATYGTILVEDPANTPSAYSSSVGWPDSSDTFWVFSGFGIDGAGFSGSMNDLWCLQSSSLPVELDYFMVD